MLNNKEQAPEVQQPFVPLVVLENALRYWWIAAAFFVIGGLGGLLVSTFRLPFYEATAQFSVAIDYVSTGPLTQYDEDLAINTAGNLFISSEVLQAIVDQAVAEGINTSMDDLRSRILLERTFSVWYLRVRHPDAQTAFRLAEIWMQQGESLLQQSYQHAVSAHNLDRYIQSQESCLVKAGGSEATTTYCNSARFVEIQKNLQEAGSAYAFEKQASWGLFIGLTLGPFNPPDVSPKPVTTGRNQYVFLGSLLGLLCGVVLIELGGPTILRAKR